MGQFSQLPTGPIRKEMLCSSICCVFLLVAGCGAPPPTPNSSKPAAEPITNPVILLSAPNPTILGGSTTTLAAYVSAASNDALLWIVNGVVGGSSNNGTITSSGTYTAPSNANIQVTITAELQEDPSVQASVGLDVISPSSVEGQIGFSFVLPNEARTSAGVYNSGGKLVRTLWRGQQYTSGPHVANWDGMDDKGNPAPDDNYQVRLLYNNVTYDWGLIGDTSTSWQGPDNWDLQSSFPQDVAISGTTAFTANEYSEGQNQPNASYFDTLAPQSPSALIRFKSGWCDMMGFVATDGKLVYFANVGDTWSGSNAFVVAVDATTHAQYHFPDGTSVSNCGNPVSGIIDVDPNADQNTDINRVHVPTGIAVQTNGPILAVSHGAVPPMPVNYAGLPSEDTIRLFDKSSGAPIGAISLPDPQRITFAPDGDLWAISGNSVIRISSVGQQNTISERLTELVKPLAIAVDPSTQDILVADGGSSQQVKRFSADGHLLSAYGDLGGYTDCDPKVTTSRLYLDETAGGGAGNNQLPGTWLAVQMDGSFWVGDLGNDRALHISSDGQYLGQIAFLRYLYVIGADHGNPTRVFADWLEYAVDYTKPIVPGDPNPTLGGNGSWSLVRNWSVCVPAKYGPGITNVHTFGDGRTYAEVVDNSIDRRQPWHELVELPASGPLRFSGEDLWESINNEGNLSNWKIEYAPSLGTSVETAKERDFSNYGSNGFPVYGNPYVLATLMSPVANSPEPFDLYGGGTIDFPELTSGGMVISYQASTSQPGTDLHLGGINKGGSDWLWKASPGAIFTYPDGMGSFPDNIPWGGGNEGIASLVEGSNVFEGYNGQYATFGSFWAHWSEDGLFIGQFGHPANGLASDGTLFPGAAGNNLSMATVTVGNDVYLYSSDEGYHPGLHRWKISGLDTIHEISGTTHLGNVVVLQ